MKKVLLSVFLFCIASAAKFQVQINVVADPVEIPSADYALLNNVMGGAGPIECYRLYAEFPAGYQLMAIYGSSISDALFSLSSGNTFYQNPNGSALAFDMQPSNSDPLYQYDSWLTIGATDLVSASSFNTTGALETTPFFENFELGYDVAIDINSLLTSEAILFLANNVDSNGLPATNLNQPDENGRVLIGQMTTRQFVSGCFTFNLNSTLPQDDTQINLTTCFSFSPDFLTADFNNDGIVDTIDLDIILAEFGCTNGCNSDLTGDNIVTVEDLMDFIYYWSLIENVN